jgi:hypothetical protein
VVVLALEENGGARGALVARRLEMLIVDEAEVGDPSYR